MTATHQQVIGEILAGDALGMSATARKVPAFRGEGRANPTTIWRWIVTGCKSPDGSIVKLEAARLGGRWLTSSAALARFLDALTPSTDPAPSPARSRKPAARKRAIEAAHKKLAAAGA